ncbi:putative HEAT repeat protein [Hortaea werneckii]|nr:putative HEAT repeat protein [Hortaea werneckii]
MKAGKPSKVVKPKQSNRKPTVTTKNHRYQSFSERIAKLKIDPIRRRRAVEEREELSEETDTYFGRSLQEWRDLNLSTTFTNFSREVGPFCDNLPVLIHNETKIMDLLVAYIERADALAMEPLLSLMSHFAHDLDTRFEKHFERAVATITAVAAKHPDPAVVEWSFTCLAWLYKYLSRLLAPDLRPLYNLMAPYLGKEQQKSFVIRFAAESLSFLVRKAAATYERDEMPLDRIVSHILQDCLDSREQRSANLYRQGVMTLMTDAIQGVQTNLHTSGQYVALSLIKAIDSIGEDKDTVARDVVLGVVTSLIHHTTAASFEPIFRIIIERCKNDTRASSGSGGFASALLFTVVSVRKGTRVSNWKSVMEAIKNLVDQEHPASGPTDDFKQQLLSLAVVSLQTATIDAVLPSLRLIETFRRGLWSDRFLRLCDAFARLGEERFRAFCLPQLQSFVSESWDGHLDELCLLLPGLDSIGVSVQLAAPDGMAGLLIKRLHALNESCDESTLAAINSTLIALPHLKINPSLSKKIKSSLYAVVRSALRNEAAASIKFRRLALGVCLQRFLGMPGREEDLHEFWPALCRASEDLYTISSFWRNMIEFCKKFPLSQPEGSPIDVLQESLISALAAPSHDVRDSALDLMQFLYKMKDRPVPEALATAITIESTPVNIETSRGISMNIRKLIPCYTEAADDALVQKAIPTYCFGLLHFKLAQAWEDAINTLRELCKTTAGEETTVAVAESWLEGLPDNLADENTPTPVTVETQGFNVVSDFECPNLLKLSTISDQVFKDASGGYLSAERQLQQDIRPAAAFTSDSRAQALRVLDKIPNLAEKRSRMLVPVLLRWAGSDEVAEDGTDTVSKYRWSRKDQKAMLGIFAKFVNPKVLYKAAEVYQALLRLCANGDVEIQRSALKAIFAWKDKSINRYEEHLTNLLDEARFRDEVSLFLHEGSEEESVRPSDEPHLMPVLLRLLYGRAVAGGKHGQGSRRKAIFVALSRFGETVMKMFVDISMSALGDGGLSTPPNAPPRQQVGMLNMLNNLLEVLGPDLEPSGLEILRGVLRCTITASKQLEGSAQGQEPEQASLLRTIRQSGFQCLVHIFTAMHESDFSDEAGHISAQLVKPRLKQFAMENTQSVSGMLRLFATWSASPRTASYLSLDNGSALAAVAELLGHPNTKDEVKLFVMQEILDKLLEDGQGEAVIEPHVTAFVKSIGAILAQQPSKVVLDASVVSISKLAEHVTDADEAQDLINVSSELLARPSKIVSPRTKTGLLHTLLPLLSLAKTDTNGPLFEAICGLFSRLRDPRSRVLLADVFVRLCRDDKSLEDTAVICRQVNAHNDFTEEPEHEERERGFSAIYERCKEFTAQQWLPIVHNCMFYIRDPEDLVNRSSASQALERFIDSTAEHTETHLPLVSHVLLPGLERGMQSPTELVRAEYLRLLGCVVEKLPDWKSVNDMRCLTVGGDDEASVFTNVLHIQQHRRLRALRRLAEEAPAISSSNVTKYFFPLLEHFVFDAAPGDAGRTLADQTVATVGSLAKCLTWSAFRATFKRYIGYIKTKEDLEKTVLRLLGVLTDALAAAPHAEIPEQEGTPNSKPQIITKEFLPPLMEYLHHKDESTVDRRMPVAVTVVKLLQLLPENEMSQRLPAVLTDVSHVLRSRSQEARDQTRKTVAAIFALIGPSYLGFIIKELRSALQRGYQLHVLSFTVHSLLVNAAEVCQPGDLDDCLPEVTAIIMDDVFGVTGQEKDAEEYKSSMKEVKSSKSFDTMELLARITPVNKLGLLLQPLRALLSEKLDTKMIKKADDLLTRLRKGVDQNPAADSRSMLVFCHEIVRQVYADEHAPPQTNGQVQDYRVRKYLIQMEAASKSKTKGATSTHIFKLATFAFNLCRKVIRRYDDLMTPSNMAGFLPLAGDALIQGQEEVKLSAIRLLATLMRLPIAELDRNASVYVKESVALIKSATSMTTDSAKASLELVTAVLREKRTVTVRETDIATIFKALKTDIDEPDRQGIIYKFLRAVLGRKIVITEVYETMDEVGKVMVTNPDRTVRESARSSYSQFVMDYPQGKDRWNKQAAFMVENLKYPNPSGRQSVMELLHQLLTKIPDDVFEQLAFTFFVALVPVQVSDTDAACRQMGGILITKIFERADEEQLKGFLNLMEKWLGNDKKPMIQVAALQCWSIYLRSKDVPPKRRNGLRDNFVELFTSDTVAVGPQLLQAMLNTFAVMIETVPDTAFARESAPIWENIQQCLGASSVDIALAAAQLVGSYHSHLASSASKTSQGLAALPIQGSGGLELDADMLRQACKTSLRGLMNSSLETAEDLVAQTIRNIVFIGRCFAANNMQWRDEAEEDESDAEEEVQEEEDARVQKRGSSALAYLLNRLSYVLRQTTFSTVARTGALQAQAALLNQLDSIPNLQSVLRPLYILTDPSIPQPPGDAHRGLSDKAHELLDLIQKKLGSEAYVAALGETRKEVKARREERRQKRKIEAVSAPERLAKEKKRKHEGARAKKKAVNAEMRGRRRGW